MIMHTFISRPGRRIQDYRNSSPRYIKVLAVGDNARAVIEAVNAEQRENVLMTGPLNPHGLQPMDEPVLGIKPHAVVVVHQQSGGRADSHAGHPTLPAPSPGPAWKGVRKTSGSGMKSSSHRSSPNSVAQMPPSLRGWEG